MPNMKSAKKAVRYTKKRKVDNNNLTASMKNAIKSTEKAIEGKDKNKALETLKVVIKKIDKAVSKGVSKKNFGSRNKSRLTKKINEMK